jgi:protein SCO1/2
VGIFRFLLVFFIPAFVLAAEPLPDAMKDVSITPTMGAMLPLSEELIDENGKTVTLGSYFDGKHPVAVILNYYGCPMLCGMLLNAAKASFEQLDWLPGHHYKIVTISIDPKEEYTLAAAKKKSIVGSIKRADLRAAAEQGWHFLVGKKGSEARIAAALGFHYKWLKDEEQWAHGTALFLSSPNGKLSRVLLGLDFPPRDLKLGLLEAGEGKVGTFAEKLVLFCYHYDPKDNKYAILATRLVSLGGVVTVLALLVAYLLWFLRERKKGNSCSPSP